MPVKGASRMLMKLTPGLNFINVLRATFTRIDSKSAKETVKSSVSFCAFGIFAKKSAREMLEKLIPDL